MANKSDAEDIFQKSEIEMSEMEKLMASIIDEKDSSAIDDVEFAELREMEGRRRTYASPVPPGNEQRRPKSRPAERAPDAFDISEIDGIRKGKAEKTAQKETLEPVSAKSRRNAPERSAAEVKKAKSATEKNVKKKMKKKKGRPVLIILLILCALLIAGAVVFNSMAREIYDEIQSRFSRGETVENVVYETDATQEEQEAYFVEIPPDTVFPEPETEESLAKMAEAAENGTAANENAIVIVSSEPAGEKKYTITVEDISWRGAQEKCISIGGHLVTVENQEELEKVIELAQSAGVEKVWIGCHRENGTLVWENNENIDFYVWGPGEPSGFDSGDKAVEDYVLLWFFNGQWVYNDSRNDPVADYPAMYSGGIAYVCEIN